MGLSQSLPNSELHPWQKFNCPVKTPEDAVHSKSDRDRRVLVQVDCREHTLKQLDYNKKISTERPKAGIMGRSKITFHFNHVECEILSTDICPIFTLLIYIFY